MHIYVYQSYQPEPEMEMEQPEKMWCGLMHCNPIHAMPILPLTFCIETIAGVVICIRSYDIFGCCIKIYRYFLYIFHEIDTYFNMKIYGDCLIQRQLYGMNGNRHSIVSRLLFAYLCHAADMDFPRYYQSVVCELCRKSNA